VIVGFGETLTVATAVFEQPAVVPVTVYEVLLTGETIIGFVVAPVLHE
jgi:ABC-type sulfate transport system permease component